MNERTNEWKRIISKRTVKHPQILKGLKHRWGFVKTKLQVALSFHRLWLLIEPEDFFNLSLYTSLQVFTYSRCLSYLSRRCSMFLFFSSYIAPVLFFHLKPSNEKTLTCGFFLSVLGVWKFSVVLCAALSFVVPRSLGFTCLDLAEGQAHVDHCYNLTFKWKMLINIFLCYYLRPRSPPQGRAGPGIIPVVNTFKDP